MQLERPKYSNPHGWKEKEKVILKQQENLKSFLERKETKEQEKEGEKQKKSRLSVPIVL